MVEESSLVIELVSALSLLCDGDIKVHIGERGTARRLSLIGTRTVLRTRGQTGSQLSGQGLPYQNFIFSCSPFSSWATFFFFFLFFLQCTANTSSLSIFNFPLFGFFSFFAARYSQHIVHFNLQFATRWVSILPAPCFPTAKSSASW